ncbi:glucans biosynthesis glucosyltransferase MdoH [Pseudohongiella sp.]|uniref:Glucans biosynthesis glucosyltransferase H n=1 Tax=marine sediment metagenome TaxID=412755 RepID=A0A0F9Z5Z5_9ZZZZ|nr:glucans biosynthesis glucosyltransferase MdoH [Pseudohongiella sp.]HDZ08176.1 glucans biosynthesis glucosyltransferase MdoH [Pseudohongiella sp.]HEA63144.1 glucans biosynthesis glucosyltransferase MdoH [Pseudohongiella sp.]
MNTRPDLALPPEQPLDMPRQHQHAAGIALRSGWSAFRARTWFMRLLLTIITLAVTSYGVYEMYAVLNRSITTVQWVFLILFSINFAWISFAGSQALLGFLLLMFRDIRGRRYLHDRPPAIRTAVLVPVYNEDPVRVAAAIETMAAGLADDAPGRFAFFILSDTNNASAWINEERTFRQLIINSNRVCPVYYRHRRDNSERKAGNIADWVTHWGGGYEAMLVLDADSVMGTDTMIELARRLEAEPGLGLLQTVPAIVWGHTLYARLQQFANRLYGPIFSHGLSIWHGEGSNFWGHNAIIRTEAFAASAHLPILKGKPPFGGHVISHDFIEAALLRRNGWGVKLATDLNDSFEEPPPSITDVMVRDRRWCQGNLQHSRFLFARGLAMTSRLHILSGIMAYMSAVFWLMLVATGLLLAVQADMTRPEYFTQPSLFPTWPVFDSERAINLFVASMAIVLLPKFLGWASAIINLRRCFRYGGPVLVTLSVLVEILLSALVAPIMMLAQSRMVWEIFTGGDSGWKPQRRDDGSIPLMDAWRRHKWHTVVGIVVSGLTFYLHHDLFLWTLPVTAGLLSSALLSWASGKRGPGQALKLFGILRTPEERRPNRILTDVTRRLESTRGDNSANAQPGLALMLHDAAFCEWHCAQLPQTPADKNRFDPAQVLAAAKAERSPSMDALEAWLTPAESMAFLHNPELIHIVARLAAGSARLQLATK